MLSLHRLYTYGKNILPAPVFSGIRSLATAFLTPIFFSYKTGHFLSSFRKSACDSDGKPIPWYTYPAIEFLCHRDFSSKIILEFGGGISTLWWSARARSVLTFENDAEWHSKLSRRISSNVDLKFVDPNVSRVAFSDQISRMLATFPEKAFDVIIVDGLFREEMMIIAQKHCQDTGVIIVDNAEGYNTHQIFLDSDFQRIDFFGYAPGVSLQHCTSFFFKKDCFLFRNEYPIARIDA